MFPSDLFEFVGLEDDVEKEVSVDVMRSGQFIISVELVVGVEVEVVVDIVHGVNWRGGWNLGILSFNKFDNR